MSSTHFWKARIKCAAKQSSTLGLLVLMATPVMRVAVSVLAFIHHRDRTYALITAAVLCLLLLSLVLGRVE